MAVDLLTEGLTVFAVIFLFELVDRTNFAVVTLAGKHPARQVWTGAALAFTVSSAISVGVGAAIVTALPSDLVWVKVVGGTILILFGLREVLKSEESQAESAGSKAPAPKSPSQVYATAFALVLFLEMGDNTQILTFEFVANAGSPPVVDVLLVIFAAATFGLWCVAALGARTGAFLRTRVAPRTLEKVLGTILVLVGGLTIAIALDPGILPAL